MAQKNYEYSDLFTTIKQKAQEEQAQNQYNLQSYKDNLKQTEESQTNFLGKVAATTKDITERFGVGVTKGVEGIADLLLGAAGSIGKSLGADGFAKTMEDIIKIDVGEKTKEASSFLLNPFVSIYQKLGVFDSVERDSYINKLSPTWQNIARGTPQAIGQMIPSILAGNFVGAGTVAGTIASMGTFGAGAGGGGVEEALNDGADITRATGYGLASGTTEVAIEFISGGLQSKLMGAVGNSGLGGVLRKLAGNNRSVQLGLQIIGDAIGEGGEEAASTLLNPLLQTIYKGTESLNQYKDPALYQQAVEDAIVGFMTSVVMTGTEVAIDHKNIINDNIQSDINRVTKDEISLQSQGKSTLENIAELRNKREGYLKELEDSMKAMNEEQRSAYVKQNEGSRLFNTYDAKTNIFDRTQVNKLGATIAEYEDVDVNALNEEQRSRVQSIERWATKYNRIAGKPVDVVIKKMTPITNADGSQTTKNAYYLNGKIYVNPDATNISSSIIGHEFTHSLEKSEGYDIYRGFIEKSLGKGKSGSIYENIYNDIKSLYSEVVKGKTEVDADTEINSEVIAKYTEQLFSDEKTIEQIVSDNRSLAQKIFDWIKEKLASLKKSKSENKMDKEIETYLKTARKLFANALAMNDIETEAEVDEKYMLVGKAYDNTLKVGDKPMERDKFFINLFHKLPEKYHQVALDIYEHGDIVGSALAVDPAQFYSDTGYPFSTLINATCYVKGSYYNNQSGFKKIVADLYKNQKETVVDALEEVGVLEKTSLDKAKEMHQVKTPMKDIVSETGWHLSKDGKWKFEISDKDAKYNVKDDVFAQDIYQNFETSHKLSQVLSHSNLYKVYPVLKNIKVQLSRALAEGEKARVDLSKGLIILNSNLYEPMPVSYKMLGEIDKMLEQLERYHKGQPTNFDNSRDEEAFNKYVASEPYEKAKDDLLDLKKPFDSDIPTQRYIQQPALMKSLIHELQHCVQEIEQWATGGTIEAGALVLQERLAREATETADYKILEAKLNILKQYHLNPNDISRLEAYMEAFVEKYVTDHPVSEEEAYYAYKRLLGEEEARAASSRMGLSQEEIKQTRKDVPHYEADSIAIVDGNIKFSLDSEGNKLSKEQTEFFKDSMARDYEGRLQRVYHGTDGEFTVFDKRRLGKNFKHLLYGKGFYFTPSDGTAQHYGDNVMSGYLNIKKPFITEEVNDANVKWLDEVNQIVQNSSLPDDVKKRLQDEYGWRQKEMKYDGAKGVIIYKYINEVNDYNKHLIDFNKMLQKTGYDGVIFASQVDGSENYVVFNSNQFKLDSNKNPTGRADIRYALDNEIIEGGKGNNNNVGGVTNINHPNSKGSNFTVDTLEKTVGRLDKRPADSLKDKLKNSWQDFQIAAIDAQAGVVNELKRLGLKNAAVITNNARAGSNAGISMIVNGQWDKSFTKRDKSLVEVFQFIDQKYGKGKQFRQATETYRKEFYDYLKHWHNTSRMDIKAKVSADAKAMLRVMLTNGDVTQNLYNTLTAKDATITPSELDTYFNNGDFTVNVYDKMYSMLATQKPVFDENTSAKDSQKKVAEYEAKYPEFKQRAQEVWKYLDNLLTLREDYGLISKDSADAMRQLYPHYIPTYRYGKGMNSSGTTNNNINNGLKRATGSDLVTEDLQKQIERLTMTVTKAIHINQMAAALYDRAVAQNDFSNVTLKSKKRITDVSQIDYEENINNNSITFYKGGEQITINVSDDIIEGFKALKYNPGDHASGKLMGLAQKANRLFKNLVTQYNPFFNIRNFFRDLQDAGLYTKYSGAFIKNYGRAIAEIKSNGTLWQKYKAAGGLYSSIFNYNDGVTLHHESLYTRISEAIEQLPRLAEFISSLEAGNSIEQALLDANDITVNFGRSGTTVKKLNNTFMPFLNAQIQGFCKMMKVIVSPKTKMQWTVLVAKATMFGILASALNRMLYDDDDDYLALRQADKDNFYLLKIGNNFIKIPKGRMLSVLSSIFNRSVESMAGNDNSWKGFANNTWQNISPVNNFRHILSPVADTMNNRTWYGGEIESQRFDNIRPTERKDESTSWIATKIAQAIGKSPKDIHYLLDQYSGVIGDIILPLTTKQNEGNPVVKNLFIDPVYSNKYSTDFYDMIQTLNYDKSDGDMVAAGKVKYLNSVASDLRGLYNQQRELENGNLPDKDAQLKTIQVAINASLKAAVENLKVLDPILRKFELSEVSFDDDYREATRLAFGAEYALRKYDERIYTKASYLDIAGIDYETFYSAYFDCKEFEGLVDDEGNTISGSKAKQVNDYIKKLPMAKTQKYILYGALGYHSKKAVEAVKRYINSLPLSKAEKKALLKACGYDE